MKKLTLVLILAALVAVGSVFADHPDGWGIGLGFQFGDSWDDRMDAGSSLSLFLKAPQLPIYWGITADIFDIGDNPSEFVLSVTGDYFLIDKTLLPEINLGWFLGVGGYFKYGRWSYDGGRYYSDWTASLIDFGARVPVGLSWQPLDLLEVFLDFGLNLGIGIYLPDEGDSDIDLGGGWQGDFGVRFWL